MEDRYKFGKSVSINCDGNHVVVGSWYHKNYSGGDNSGHIWVSQFSERLGWAEAQWGGLGLIREVSRGEGLGR